MPLHLEDVYSIISRFTSCLWILVHVGKCYQGFVFVDRDGTHFRHILNWLRDGVVPTLSESEYSELLREANYYQLIVSPIVLPFIFY